MNLILKQLGWNEYLEKQFISFKQEGLSVGRITSEQKNMYRVITESGELLAEISGKYRYNTVKLQDYPAVGDWVVLSERINEGKATIHHLLPRFSKFSRKIAGKTTEEQIVASNIDTVFLVQSLNDDLNLRRLERYLMMAWESGANPVIVLTKSDLCTNINSILRLVDSVAFGIPIHVTSVINKTGLDNLRPYFQVGKTIALLGSSGTGKSTLTNYFLGANKQKVNEIREDGKGRHTTTYRELIIIPGGGMIIDTPGMRELQLWDTDSGLSQSFQDIETLAENCQFSNCTHKNEPNCAVKEALIYGELSESRLKSYFKLQKELEYIKRKNDIRLQKAEKEKWKKVTKMHRK